MYNTMAGTNPLLSKTDYTGITDLLRNAEDFDSFKNPMIEVNYRPAVW